IWRPRPVTRFVMMRALNDLARSRAGTGVAPYIDVMDATGARKGHPVIAVIGAATIGALVFSTSGARAAWDEISRFLTLQGKPEPASANVLSEHEIDAFDSMTPQAQAELLLERSINHYAGANDQIAARAKHWRGHVTLNTRLNNLFVTAINSD